MGLLDGKVTVVTGASRGIGEAIAVGYAKEGANVVLAARTGDDLERVAEACRQAGAPSALAVITDITIESDVQNLIGKTLAEHGKLDVFVANAGTSYPNLTDKRYRELVTYDLDIVEQIFKVNVFGTWLCAREALKAFKEGGSLILVGSETARVLYPGAGVYALSKASIDAMTTLAARESAEQSVRVNCLTPGQMVDTHLFGPNKMPDFLKSHGFMEADELVPAAVWLASDDSKAITGGFLVAKDFNEKPLEEVRASMVPQHRGH